MADLHEQVQECKDLGVQALISQDPVAKAMYDHAFWALMNDNREQVLDILDDALQAHKDGKI